MSESQPVNPLAGMTPENTIDLTGNIDEEDESNSMTCLVVDGGKKTGPTDSRKRKRSQAEVAKLSTGGIPTKPLPSETKRYQLAQTYLHVEVEGRKRLVRVALDTQSNVTYVHKHMGTVRQWKQGEARTVRGIGGIVTEGIPLTLTIVKKGKLIKLDARSAPAGILDQGCEALLSAKHCDELRIDVNYALKHLPHLPV